MFDLEVFNGSYASDVLIESLRFEHMISNQTVELYATNNGSYAGKEQLDDQWSKVASLDIEGVHAQSELVLGAPIPMPPGSKRGFYLATVDAKDSISVGQGRTTSFGSGRLAIRGGRATFNSSGINATGFYPVVQAGYSANLPSMNHLIAKSSVFVSPTQSPSSSPSQAPTTHPSVSPSSSPSLGPSASPTKRPSLDPSTSPTVTDNGPFLLAAESTCDKDCLGVPGYMFSVKARKKGDVTVTGVRFEHSAPKQHRQVELYRTVSGSFSGKEQTPEAWVKVATMTVPRQRQIDELLLDVPITLSRGEAVGFYLKTEEPILQVDKNGRQRAQDGRLQLNCGSAITDGGFGASLEGYSWKGAVTYSTVPLAGLSSQGASQIFKR